MREFSEIIVFYFAFSFCDKCLDQKQHSEERLIWITHPCHSPILRKPTAGRQAETMEELD